MDQLQRYLRALFVASAALMSCAFVALTAKNMMPREEFEEVPESINEPAETKPAAPRKSRPSAPLYTGPRNRHCIHIYLDDRALIKTHLIVAVDCRRTTESVPMKSGVNKTQIAVLFPLQFDDPLPLKEPRVRKQLISSLFGIRKHPVSGQIKSHNGMDLPAPSGSPTLAGLTGTVTEAGLISDGCGYGVRISAPGNVELTYCHMSAFARGIATGKQVTRGETIGYVGSTGLVTGPHVHLQVKIGETPIDPLSVAWDFLVDPR